jgi:hypothetical protein
MALYLNGLKTIGGVELSEGILHMSGAATVWNDTIGSRTETTK